MKGLAFFLGLEKYMNSRLVLATIWEGPNVVKTEPAKPGDTNPAESKAPFEGTSAFTLAGPSFTVVIQ